MYISHLNYSIHFITNEVGQVAVKKIRVTYKTDLKFTGQIDSNIRLFGR